MKTITAERFMANDRFIQIATKGAVDYLATLHKTTAAKIKGEILGGNAKLQSQMLELIYEAAEESAKRANTIH